MTMLEHNQHLPNTLALACTADALSVSSAEQAQDAVRLAKERGHKLLPLGEGSNVVLPEVLQGIALYVTDRSVATLREDEDHIHLRVGAGLSWHELVCDTVGDGYGGLENLALIPGTVGAAPVQNIGAYGREVSAFIEAVHGVDLESGAMRTLEAGECEFSYRHSIFKGALRDRFLICSVDFCLAKHGELDVSYPALSQRLEGSPDLSAREVLQAVVALRRERLPDPDIEPNVGSFFKNPVISAAQLPSLPGAQKMPRYPQADGRVKLSAAWLIDSCCLKGAEEGGARVSPRHALVISNSGDATQGDVLRLAQRIIDEVERRYALVLELEPRVYGHG